MEPHVCVICRRQTVPVPLMELPDMVSQERFMLVQHPCCQVIRTLPVPLSLDQYYDSDVGRSMHTSPSRMRQFLHSILLQAELRRITRHLAPRLVLDVGCGAGEFAQLLHQRGWPVIAIDAGSERPPCLASCPTLPYYQIDFETCEIAGLPRADGGTGVVRHVLEHVKDPGAFLERLTAFGASSFYVVVPNAAAFSRRVFGRYWGMWDPPRHLWHFDARSLQQLFARLRMTVLEMGCDTIPDIGHSVYRFLRLHGSRPALYNLFTPRGTLSSLAAPLNWLLPFNVVWAVVRTDREGP